MNGVLFFMATKATYLQADNGLWNNTTTGFNEKGDISQYLNVQLFLVHMLNRIFVNFYAIDILFKVASKFYEI